MDPISNKWLIISTCIPAETRGQSGNMDSTDVSSGSELDTQLQQFCEFKEDNF